ncbi:MAG: glutaminyl-peptide cyclotransferase [Planctomycetes bacterium]|nr:glutaminyl-peptide cyclotransferase [Planctomycetota bacterium]
MGPARYTYEVVNTYPHETDAFTQGLAFEDGLLYEGTGIEGRSSLREVELETGKVRRKVDLDARFFGEGITVLDDRIYQLTWKNEIGFIYDRRTFDLLSRIGYSGEGWGLTNDGRHLIMSNGLATLQFLDSKTFRVVRTIRVTEGDRLVKDLNELEYVEGEIFANVWHVDRIARIDPESGRLTAWIDMSGLLPGGRPHAEAVLNGIAYDRKGKRLFVTGKEWPKLFEIRIVSAS